MSAATTEPPIPALPAVQRPALAAAAILALGLGAALWADSAVMAAVLLVGIGLGVSLYHAGFGFTAAYRRAIVDKELSGIVAQAAMLMLASLLFAPMLAAGEVFGRGVGGAVAPVGVDMLTGALMFGIGMQLGGACASGTLFTAGGGNPRMLVVLVFFCAGSWWGTLDLPWWRSLPALPPISLAQAVGWGPALLLQATVLCLILWLLHRLGGRVRRPLWWNGRFSGAALLRGPWPLLLGALALAVLNAVMLALTGSPWGVTWGFALWGAKAASALGWDPATSLFWSADWSRTALQQSVLASTTSVSNIGIVIGAFLAAALAGALRPSWRIGWRPLLAAIVGGLLMGYGARLAYGCNIGAFFSGVASTSLHGWAWIAMALVGTAIGIRMRPWFDLANP
ncbi:MAG: YeeE/YedE family protein [Thalassobaculum sp.]|uniref:YeeE/YedE family protein n=1 Tax=Thalassobaculum sp. TaxID=2022740 RepID=UPI0032F00CEB